MAIATLNAILQKIRKLIGSPNTLQISDSDLEDYVNSFYLYDLPAQFRSLKLKDIYTFTTQEGVDVYPFNSEQFTTVSMPCYIAKREVKLFNDEWSFYASYFNWQSFTNFAIGDGVNVTYTGFTGSRPILRSSNNNPNPFTNPGYPTSRVQNILITANTSLALGQTQNVTDDGNGNLIQQVGGFIFPAGTINYATGAISVTFQNIVPAGETIQIQYNPISLSTPLAILFYQNQFTLRPVPDRGYTVELTTYRAPNLALANTLLGQGEPELNEWWELIAVGAAKKFFEDSLDMEGMAMMDKLLREKYALAATRTYAQIGQQRVATMFSDQLNYNYGSGANMFGSV